MALDDTSLRTYLGKGSGLFYVISGTGPIHRADCFSRGFATRVNAENFKARLLSCAAKHSLSLWDAMKMPSLFPDNGRPYRDLQDWEHNPALDQAIAAEDAATDSSQARANAE